MCPSVHMIDERTKCSHRGQEVDPAGERLRCALFLSHGSPVHPSMPPLPAHSHSTAVYFSLFV